DFLFKRKQVDTTTNSKMNLAALADKLIHSVLYKIPENMELKQFKVSYRDDSTEQVVSIPQATIDDGDLQSTIVVNQDEAIWHADGQLNPNKKRLHIRLYAKDKPVE